MTSFLQGERLQNLISIPGVVEAGWSAFHLYPGTTERDRNAAQSKLTAFLKSLMEAIRLSSEYKDLNERLVDFEVWRQNESFQLTHISYVFYILL